MAKIRISLTRSFKVAVSENNYIHTYFILLTWEYIWKKLKVGYNVEHLFIIILLGTIFGWSSKSCCKEKINEPYTFYYSNKGAAAICHVGMYYNMILKKKNLVHNLSEGRHSRHRPNSPGPLTDDWKVTDDSSINFHDVFFFIFPKL